MLKISRAQFFSKMLKFSRSSLVYPGPVAMVDDLLNTEVEKPAIGLLICKEKNTVLARYALSTINRPMGISEYEVARQQLPDDLKNALPSPEEIEQGLMDK
jgi:hypothetical protein